MQSRLTSSQSDSTGGWPQIGCTQSEFDEVYSDIEYHDYITLPTIIVLKVYKIHIGKIKVMKKRRKIRLQTSRKDNICSCYEIK